MELILWLAMFACSVVFHEASHGMAANLLGDDTAKRFGRLSLNPLRHIDLFWTILLPLSLYFLSSGRFIFAMAKPVPVDFSRLHDPKKDMALVAIAGPLANIILAILLALGWKFFPVDWLLYAVYLNLGLAIFNLLPLPPLDGSRVAASFMNGKTAYHYLRWESFGYLILFALYFFGFLSPWLLGIINQFCRLLNVPLISGVS